MGKDETTTPVIVASENGRKGTIAAMALLQDGGRALDAVELACRITEDDPEEHSVGYGGLPNVLGEVELDASIMDGRTIRTGAVAAVQGYANPITLARMVMDELPHVLLVGRGAERFAVELGYEPTDQRSDAAMRRWSERFEEYDIELGTMDNLRETTESLTRPLDLQDIPTSVGMNGKDDTLGTVNFLIIDQHGDMASAVSTSGLGWKYPSRVGDSPIIGAGHYCDNRYGAVGCTGMGELAIRVSTARSLILYLKMGMSLEEAGLEALRDLSALEQVSGRYMNIVALTPDGSHAGFSTVPEKKYLFCTAEMAAPELATRTVLA